MKSAKWEQMRTLLDIPTSAKLVKNASVELLKKQQQKIQVQVLILVSACSSWIPAI